MTQDYPCPCGGIRLTRDGPCLACGSIPVAEVPPPVVPDPAWYDQPAPTWTPTEGG